MKVEERVAALVALVEADLASRRQAVLEPAARQADELLRGARRAARSRVATAIAEERAAYDARVGSAEARLATARRMAEQRRLRALVSEGWERLGPALVARWKDPDGRRQWVEAALSQARSLLPATGWRIEAAADWAEGERAGIDAEIRLDPAIAAGLRIRRANVEIDATLDGLLADRFAVEGRLLHWHLENQKPQKPGSDPGLTPVLVLGGR